MLFNSYEFLLFFLPVTLAGWFVCGRWAGMRAAQVWLTAASLFYYGWWNPWYLILIITLTLANYGWGRVLARRAASGLPRGLALGVGVAVNLCILGYYKYANFFLDNLNTLTGSNWVMGHIILPAGHFVLHVSKDWLSGGLRARAGAEGATFRVLPCSWSFFRS